MFHEERTTRREQAANLSPEPLRADPGTTGDELLIEPRGTDHPDLPLDRKH